MTRLAKRRRRPAPGGSYELTADQKDAYADYIAKRGEDVEVVNPRADQRIPNSGAWVMITRPLPPMERDAHRHVRPGRVFYAQHEGGTDEAGFAPTGRYKVRLTTPVGDVSVWPYEYHVVPTTRLLDLLQHGALAFRPFDVSPAQLNDTVFYCRSRGIGLGDALAIALGTLAAPVGWLEPAADLATDIEALATRLSQSLADHIRLHPRRLDNSTP